MGEGAVIHKNEEFEIDITDIGNEGEGVGRVKGYTLFVKDALPGDRVRVRITKVKKSFGYARLISVITPSADRVEPACPLAGRCGGCRLMHLGYEKQLAFKQEKLLQCLKRIGGVDASGVMEPIVGMDRPFRYRNKAQFPVGRNKEGRLVTGFYAGRTHSVIDTRQCLIQSETSDEVLNRVRDFLERRGVAPYDEKTHTGLIRHILIRVGFATGDIMVCLVVNGTGLPAEEELARELGEMAGMKCVALNENTEKTNVILGSRFRTLWGQDAITDRIGDVTFRISPASFYQVNPVQTERLYETALDYAALDGTQIVWDLYCGIGTISLFLARKAGKVYGVEIVPAAVRDARENARQNGIENVEFFTGAAEEVMPALCQERGESVRADVVVLDPPRKGCDAVLLNTILEAGPERIVYISCDPATLARDMGILCGGGYELRRARAFDMFCMGTGVESIVLLSHKSPDGILM